MKAIAIIPARIGSTRFPGKPLARLAGKEIILHVVDAVSASGIFEQVIVATDSAEIFELVQKSGFVAAFTRPDHPSGSDRVAEVAASLDADIIVNVQGDEPFMDSSALWALVDAFEDVQVQMASLMTPIEDMSGLTNPNVVKVVCDRKGNALYFSRAPIPHDRDGGSGWPYMRHIGVYAWRRETLMRFVNMNPSPLEEIEKLEQLRALENGISIRMVKTDYQGMGIDTPEDLKKAEAILASPSPASS